MTPLAQLRCPLDPDREATLSRDEQQLICSRARAVPHQAGLPVLVPDEAELPAKLREVSQLPASAPRTDRRTKSSLATANARCYPRHYASLSVRVQRSHLRRSAYLVALVLLFSGRASAAEIPAHLPRYDLDSPSTPRSTPRSSASASPGRTPPKPPRTTLPSTSTPTTASPRATSCRSRRRSKCSASSRRSASNAADASG